MPLHGVDAGLAARVAATDPAELMPARFAGRPEPADLLDGLDLGDGRRLLVLRSGPSLLVPAVVEGAGGLRAARAGDGAAERLLALIARGGREGAFEFDRLGDVARWSGEASIDVDQSNESVIVGGRAVVKRFARTSAANRRPTVLPAHLLATGFHELPAPLGTIGWRREGRVAPLVIASVYLPGATDGWDWYVEMVERSISGAPVDPIEPAAELGRVAARLHVALATPTRIVPDPRARAGPADVRAWKEAAEADLHQAMSLIDGPEGERLRSLAASVRVELAGLRGDGTPSVPIHGDLHVGQFLRWPGGLAVSDLDGDPLGPGTIAGPAARDAASLVQSLDHVGRIVERRHPEASVGAWIRAAVDACLSAYRTELAARGAADLFDERLLRPFRVAQELHEYVYAARYLPGWRYVPDRALPALLEEDP